MTSQQSQKFGNRLGYLYSLLYRHMAISCTTADSNGSGHHYTSSQRLLTPSSERQRVTATHLLPQIREFGDQQSILLTTSDHAGHSYVGNLLGI